MVTFKQTFEVLLSLIEQQEKTFLHVINKWLCSQGTLENRKEFELDDTCAAVSIESWESDDDTNELIGCEVLIEVVGGTTFHYSFEFDQFED